LNFENDNKLETKNLCKSDNYKGTEGVLWNYKFILRHDVFNK